MILRILGEGNLSPNPLGFPPFNVFLRLDVAEKHNLKFCHTTGLSGDDEVTVAIF